MEMLRYDNGQVYVASECADEAGLKSFSSSFPPSVDVKVVQFLRTLAVALSSSIG